MFRLASGGVGPGLGESAVSEQCLKFLFLEAGLDFLLEPTLSSCRQKQSKAGLHMCAFSALSQVDCPDDAADCPVNSTGNVNILDFWGGRC